jgi:hypothetical protein
MDLPASLPAARSIATPPSPRRSLATRAALALAVVASVVACSSADDPSADDPSADGEGSTATTDAALTTAGPCAGKAIDRAVKCAEAKGARVLSYYRSAADQERVRRENGCINRCTGSAGCVRPTADCTTSPHTACHAVDLVADGAPVSRAALRACGLAKTTARHANHYDLVN